MLFLKLLLIVVFICVTVLLTEVNGRIHLDIAIIYTSAGNFSATPQKYRMTWEFQEEKKHRKTLNVGANEVKFGDAALHRVDGQFKNKLEKFTLKCENIDQRSGDVMAIKGREEFDILENQSYFFFQDECSAEFTVQIQCAQHYFHPPECLTYCKQNQFVRSCSENGVPECREGFKGTNCLADLCNSPVGDILCKNGGICLSTESSYKCNCTTSYEGPTCAQDVDECTKQSHNCEHGICENTEGSFVCRCQTGFTGPTCQEDIDECSLNVCKNDASCKNTRGGYTCTCRYPYTGSTCDVNTDSCSTAPSPPCLNGGTCVNSKGSYYCNCTQSYHGKSCESELEYAQIKSNGRTSLMIGVFVVVGAFVVVVIVGSLLLGIRRMKKNL